MKAILSRGVLLFCLLGLVAYALWHVPLPGPDGRVSDPVQLDWQLPASPLPPQRDMAKRLMTRLGWQSGADNPSGEAAINPSGDAAFSIIGLSRQGGRVLLIGRYGQAVHSYAIGDRLPDGRRLVAIEGFQIQLEGEEKEQLQLFSYPRPGPEKKGAQAGEKDKG